VVSSPETLNANIVRLIAFLIVPLHSEIVGGVRITLKNVCQNAHPHSDNALSG